MIKYTDSGIAKYANKLPEGKIITLNCNLSLLCFFSRNYIQSQKYINQLLDYVGRSSRYNFITVLMRTLELINHLLLREYDLADMKWPLFVSKREDINFTILDIIQQHQFELSSEKQTQI